MCRVKITRLGSLLCSEDMMVFILFHLKPFRDFGLLWFRMAKYFLIFRCNPDLKHSSKALYLSFFDGVGKISLQGHIMVRFKTNLVVFTMNQQRFRDLFRFRDLQINTHWPLAFIRSNI